MSNIECLKDCNASCCRKRPDLKVIFDFSDQDVKMFQQAGATLTKDPLGGYMMVDDCVFLTENQCTLHRTAQQPDCCDQNHAGGSLCIAIRKFVSGQRSSNVE